MSAVLRSLHIIWKVRLHALWLQAGLKLVSNLTLSMSVAVPPQCGRASLLCSAKYYLDCLRALTCWAIAISSGAE